MVLDHVFGVVACPPQRSLADGKTVHFESFLVNEPPNAYTMNPIHADTKNARCFQGDSTPDNIGHDVNSGE